MFSTAAELASMLDTIRVLTSIPKPTLLPIGVGFIGWILDRLPEADADTLLETALDQSVAIWLAFGVDLGKYARKVREYDARKHRKTLLFVMVNSVEAALKAAGEWKADVIVAQGKSTHRKRERDVFLCRWTAILIARDVFLFVCIWQALKLADTATQTLRRPSHSCRACC